MATSNSDQNREPSPSGSDADLAQAYKDLARGEQAATALEANLTHLESKLNAILAAIEANEAQKPKPAKPNDDAKSSSNGDEKPAKDATDKDDAA